MHKLYLYLIFFKLKNLSKKTYIFNFLVEKEYLPHDKSVDQIINVGVLRVVSCKTNISWHLV